MSCYRIAIFTGGDVAAPDVKADVDVDLSGDIGGGIGGGFGFGFGGKKKKKIVNETFKVHIEL